MSFEKLVEKKIKEAIDNGEFDNLTGAAVNLDLYFATPEDLRAGYSVMKNAGIVPEELELMKEIGRLKDEMNASSDDETRSRLSREIQDKTLKLNLLLDHYRRRRKA